VKILCTGGCGYVGSALVPALLSLGHMVIVIDTQWFGVNLQTHERLVIERADIRDNYWRTILKDVDCVIHLAAVANDPCGELDPKITWEVNALATMQLIDAAARAGVRHFIYASSGSVYGIKSEEQVTEDLSCEPLSEYNKTKMVAEKVVLSYLPFMRVQVLRPATVCGYSPRTRLDVAVNALTIGALSNQKIKVLGGLQVRPNIHIEDMVRVYLHMLANRDFIGVCNAGFENISIFDIANKVKAICGGELEVVPSNDPRSYRLSSRLLLSSGFKQLHTVDGAIWELKRAFDDGMLKDTDNGYNLRTMPR